MNGAEADDRPHDAVGPARICVYCGSSPGRSPEHAAAAVELGAALAGRGITLVYGGGNVGLMGILADTVLECGGEVIGVIPAFLLEREVAHDGLTELRVVESMHQRKEMMEDLSDAVVALPGGFGTLDELAEMLTWSQLGLHDKPVVLLDVDGYWSDLLAWCDRAVAEGFLRPRHRALLRTATDVATALDLAAAPAPAGATTDKWVDRR